MSEPVCPICKKLWSEEPGTMYCGHQHGFCPICEKPRTLGSCHCMTTPIGDDFEYTPDPKGEPA